MGDEPTRRWAIAIIAARLAFRANGVISSGLSPRPAVPWRSQVNHARSELCAAEVQGKDEVWPGAHGASSSRKSIHPIVQQRQMRSLDVPIVLNAHHQAHVGQTSELPLKPCQANHLATMIARPDARCKDIGGVSTALMANSVSPGRNKVLSCSTKTLL